MSIVENFAASFISIVLKNSYSCAEGLVLWLWEEADDLLVVNFFFCLKRPKINEKEAYYSLSSSQMSSLLVR